MLVRLAYRFAEALSFNRVSVGVMSAREVSVLLSAYCCFLNMFSLTFVMDGCLKTTPRAISCHKDPVTSEQFLHILNFHQFSFVYA